MTKSQTKELTESTPTQTVDFASIFNHLPNGYIVMKADDPTFTIVAENKAHAVVGMVNTSDVLGKPLLEAFPDTSDQYKQTGVSDLVESFRRVVKTKQPDAMSLIRYDLRDQTGVVVPRYWRVTHYPIVEKGSVTYIFQATEDVTAEVLSTSKLKQVQQQLNEALSVGLIGTWLWDINADIVIGDKYMAKMFGVEAEEAAKGLPLEVFTSSVHETDRERVQSEIASAMQTGHQYETEYRTVTRDGSIGWILARGRIERDSSGNPSHFPGVLVDITDRKQAELNLGYLAKASAVLASSLDYRKTLTAITNLMVPDIADWCMIDILDETDNLQLLSVAHADPDKIALAERLRSKDGPELFKKPTAISKVLRTGKSLFYPVITPAIYKQTPKSRTDQKIIDDLGITSLIIVPIKVRDKVRGTITMMTTDQKRTYNESDLEMAEELSNRTSLAMSNAGLYYEAQRELKERIRLEEELRVANEQLEHRVDVRTSELEQTNLSLARSNQELQDFAYVASHDLQEPLRKIQAFGNLLETEYAVELGDGNDYLRRMRSAAARMSTLIEDILSFSRVTTKARGFTLVSLPTVVQEVIGDLEIRIAETSATIHVEDLPTIHADAMQMRQLLQNLLANAIKFHRPDVKPVITVRSQNISGPKHEKWCKIEVIDNGLGFDEKYLNRIFSVFQRLHTRDSYEGTGIGLAVCRKIVERHGGSITATSRPGKGSSFIITLPLRHKKGETLA